MCHSEFKARYAFFGSMLEGAIAPSKSLVKLESECYPILKRAAEKRGWLYNRVETLDKRGMPDILVTRGAEYWYVEVKFLHRKKLLTIEDSLKWQFGQLAFFRNCIRNNSRYLLVVASSKNLLFMREISLQLPDFVLDFV